MSNTLETFLLFYLLSLQLTDQANILWAVDLFVSSRGSQRPEKYFKGSSIVTALNVKISAITLRQKCSSYPLYLGITCYLLHITWARNYQIRCITCIIYSEKPASVNLWSDILSVHSCSCIGTQYKHRQIRIPTVMGKPQCTSSIA